MPKTLSLKKSQQPPKSQKSITSFFKSSQSSPTKSFFSQTACLNQQSMKRKAATSAVIEIIDDSSSDISIVNARESCNQNVQKKIKSSSSPDKNHMSTLKSSPESTKGHTPSKKVSPKVTVICKKTDHVVKNLNFELKSVTQHDGSNQQIPQENHVLILPKNVYPEPLVISANNTATKKKSPLKKSPVKALPNFNTENVASSDLSPSKQGSTTKVLNFEQKDINDEFNDDWAFEDSEEIIEDLDLSTMQRCEILSVTNHQVNLELRLKNSNNNQGTCFVEGIWTDTPLTPGEVISVLAIRNASGQYTVSNNSGLIALRPDHLVSSTSVVAGVFCKRKAVLQERWRGIDSANTAMTIGILIHELVQKALTHNITDVNILRKEMESIVKQSLQMLYDAGLSEAETLSNMQAYISSLGEFMKTYFGKSYMNGKQTKWNGHVDKVLDIEENVCCPQLGLKGKIDATLQVTIHGKKGNESATVPLELKSGKASMSAEHRGQLVLYGMMLALQRGEDPTQAVQRGLLLYLKERVELREVSCGHPEKRDLIMLRNQLVQHLAPGSRDIDPEQLTDIEEASLLLQQSLPEPVHHENACAKCPYLTICSLHLWHTCGPTVSEKHPLTKLREQALGHLTSDHIKYFLHWTALLKMEERGQMKAAPLHALWNDSVEKRSKRGTCIPYLKLAFVEPSGDRFLHVFHKQRDNLKSENVNKGPQEGEFSIVSIDNRPWIAAGVVTVAKENEIQILLERDLSRRLSKETEFHIDTYESYASTVQNLTNLGVLMEDSDRALRLRQIIIEKQEPEFEKKLPREVGRLGTKLMRTLNIEQQRAVLKALASKDYALLRGLPGTGKTQTISVLIQMLVGLKLRVLVTAHTHSAVDTVLNRLPETVRVMRLGSSARVSPSLHSRCEQHLIASCSTPEELAHLYDSMEVVGVTCLGANHAMLSRTTFDVCIVDEATQVLQCTVLRPLFAAKRFVLVGDPEQLPPVVRSRAARRLGMEESLFHRLTNEEATSTLQLQYRMNQALVNVANKVSYRDKLKCADEGVAQAKINLNTQILSRYVDTPWLSKSCSPEPECAAIFLDMKLTQISSNEDRRNCSNVEETCVVTAVVEVLLEGDVKSCDIGVIAPFRDQVALLRRCLSRHTIDVSTVDQFQGRDKSVIIYSCTKHNDGQNDRQVKEGEILNDHRRLAVSVTRAKHKLIVIGNSTALQRYKPLQILIGECITITLNSEEIREVVNKYKEFVT